MNINKFHWYVLPLVSIRKTVKGKTKLILNISKRNCNSCVFCSAPKVSAGEARFVLPEGGENRLNGDS